MWASLFVVQALGRTLEIKSCKSALFYSVPRFGISSWYVCRKKMRKTIITLNAEDIFTLVRESDTKLFSADSISADTVSVLCSDIRKRVVERKIMTSGSMAVRITSPVVPELTLAETLHILEEIQENRSGNLLWGFVSDDSVDRITADILFEVEQ